MTDRTPGNKLGPLPKFDRNATLQQLSIQAFTKMLPPELFCLRDEPRVDAGVDCSLELLIDSRSTNLRAQVQLKSTDSTHLNGDGTVSLPIPVSNLNYLLNGPSPLYVLYIAPRDELRFAWARDERQRLEHANPSWLQQRKVTLRFEHILTQEALLQIHDRIRKEAQFHRHVSDTLASSAATERVVLSVDPTTLQATNPNDIYERLLTGGLTLVASGYAPLVLELRDTLNASQKRAPRVCLVCAYAHFVLSDYSRALGELASVKLHSNQLSADDQLVLGNIEDACHLHTGRIDVATYVERQNTRYQHASGMSARAHRLNALRYEVLVERDPVRGAQLLGELRSLVGQVLASSSAPPACKLQARLFLLYAETSDYVFALSQEFLRLRADRALGRVPQMERLIDLAGGRWQRLAERLDQAVRDAASLQHPILTADALYTRVHFETARLANYCIHRVASEGPVDISARLIAALMERADESARLYAQANDLEGELRSKMLLADLCELGGHHDQARALGEEVLPKAQAMDYARIEVRARGHQTGRTELAELKENFRQILGSDQDIVLAARTEEEARQMARPTLTALDLPDDRLPVIERECLSLRDVARERLEWCRYLQLVQDGRHAQQPSTHYRKDPDRHCRCDVHHYESRIGIPDWTAVISAFKQTYCRDCPDRDPKKPS